MPPTSGLRTTARARVEHRLSAATAPFDRAALVRSALVVAPHFDDETLGCGGTIARKVDEGASVTCVFLTDGAASHREGSTGQRVGEVRRREAVAALAALGLSEGSIVFGDFPDGSLADHHTAAVDLVSSVLATRQPADVFVPHVGDGHADHRAATLLAFEAVARERPGADVYEYPVWHWQQWPWVRLAAPWRRRRWRPSELHGDAWRRSVRGRFGLRFAETLDRVVDIEATLARKLAAVGCYDSQIRRDGRAADWATLDDVSYGDFLDCLRRDREYFRLTPGAEEPT